MEFIEFPLIIHYFLFLLNCNVLLVSLLEVETFHFIIYYLNISKSHDLSKQALFDHKIHSHLNECMHKLFLMLFL